MATRAQLKALFETGDTPTQSDFAALIDSLGHLVDDDLVTGTELTAGLATKQATLVSGSNIKTINGTTILGSGNFTLATVAELTDGLAAKQATLVSGTNIKTINGTSILGSGDIVISGASNSALARTWTLPGSSLDLVTIASISGTSGYAEHGPFRFWTELHANDAVGATGFDYVFSLGFNGNGTTQNISLITWETSYDTGGGWKTDEFYFTKRHPGNLPHWPTRRIGPCFSTFSTNRGDPANGTVVGLMNCDNTEFHATQPAVSGTSLAGWNYANLTNNFATGTTTLAIQSHATNFGQYKCTVSGSGLAQVITGNLTTSISGQSIQLVWSGGSFAINGSTKVFDLTGTTLQVTNPADGGSSPAAQFFNGNPNNFGYNTVELRTQAANQVASLGLWNQNVAKWAIKNRGDSSDALTIFNDTLDTDALTIANATNDMTVGGKMTLSAATTTRASLNIPSGTAPSSPANGDIWFDGSNLRLRSGGATFTIQKA